MAQAPPGLLLWYWGAGAHRDPEALIRYCNDLGITHLQMVPSMLKIMLASDQWSDTLALKTVYSGGEALSRDIVALAQKFDFELVNLYGPTECTIDSTFYRVPIYKVPKDDGMASENGGELAAVPIGRPIANLECVVLDDQQRIVPMGVAGELYIGGLGVGCGYLNRPELTQERFVELTFAEQQSRYYRTGDLVSLDEQGQLIFLGRIDRQVKLNGFRIELGEVESIVETSQHVQQTAQQNYRYAKFHFTRFHGF